MLAVALAMPGERTVERLSEIALDAALATTRAERGLLLLAHVEDGYQIMAARYLNPAAEERGLLGLSSTIATRALANRELIVCEDIRVDERFRDCASIQVDVASVLCVPILARSEQQGALYLDRSRRGATFDARAVECAQAIGGMLAAALLTSSTISKLEARSHELEHARKELDTALARRTAQRDDAERVLASLRDAGQGMHGLVGSSAPMTELARRLARVAGSDALVLVSGETGTGKELVARAVHAASPRRDGPFVAVHGGALSETSLESELFGVERDARRGTDGAHVGLLEAAQGGTFLLDEVGELPPAVQVALLRVLESSEIRPLGATRPRKIDVRFVATTRHDLGELVANGAFREDLRYRLEVVRLEVPPLRERLGDLSELCAEFLHDIRRRYDLPERRIAQGTLEALSLRRWPGNVRELQHVLTAAALSAQGDEIAVRDVPREAMNALNPELGRAAEASSQDGHAARVEAIRRALRATAGHRGRAAELLGVARSTLYRYLELYAIDLRDFEAPAQVE